METFEGTADQLNSLLRGELSAVETYNQALERMKDFQACAELRRIESEHREAVSLLRQKIMQLGAQPSATSGPWGAWAQMVTGAAKVFGEEAVLKALKEGEEHGLKDYEAAVEDEDVDMEAASLIRTTLLPRQRTHISTLDQYLTRH